MINRALMVLRMLPIEWIMVDRPCLNGGAQIRPRQNCRHKTDIRMDFCTQTRMGGGKLSNPMRKQVFPFLPSRERPGGRLAGLVACLLFAMTSSGGGQTADSLPLSSRVSTNITEIWRCRPDQKNEEYRIRTQAVIYFSDPAWNNVWGECQGVRTWMPFDGSPIPFKAGQRVAIDGSDRTPATAVCLGQNPDSHPRRKRGAQRQTGVRPGEKCPGIEGRISYRWKA